MVVQVDGSILLPRTVFPKEKKPYVPVDPVREALKVSGVSSALLIGMHLRRKLQYRKASARPGVLRYLNQFDMGSRMYQFVSIPISLGLYAFLSGSLANLSEDVKPSNEFISVFAAMAVASSFKPNMSVAKGFGFAVGVGSLAALFAWTQGFSLGENSYIDTKLSGNLEKSKTDPEGKQGFWEVLHRRPYSRVIAEYGEGRGIGKM